MKKIIIVLTSLFLAGGVFAQGTIAFNNAEYAPVTVNGFTADSSYSVELLYGGSVIATTRIIALGYFVTPGVVTIDGVAAGSTADLQIRVFKTDLGSWDAAVAVSIAPGTYAAFGGKTENQKAIPLTISLPLGGGLTPTPAPGLGNAIAAAGGFHEVVVPEPGVLALGLVGAGTFFMRRRRRG